MSEGDRGGGSLQGDRAKRRARGLLDDESLETGIVTAGTTRDEAEARNGEAHILLVRRVKRLGLVALAEFMDSHGVDYEIGDPAHANRSVEQLPLAA